MPEATFCEQQKRPFYIYIAGPTKRLLHQTLVLKAGSLQNWLVVPSSHYMFPVPSSHHRP